MTEQDNRGNIVLKWLREEYQRGRKQGIDECIKALQNDLPKEELEFEQANLYAGGIHRAIYVLEKLKKLEGDK